MLSNPFFVSSTFLLWVTGNISAIMNLNRHVIQPLQRCANKQIQRCTHLLSFSMIILPVSGLWTHICKNKISESSKKREMSCILILYYLPMTSGWAHWTASSFPSPSKSWRILQFYYNAALSLLTWHKELLSEGEWAIGNQTLICTSTSYKQWLILPWHHFSSNHSAQQSESHSRPHMPTQLAHPVQNNKLPPTLSTKPLQYDIKHICDLPHAGNKCKLMLPGTGEV